MKKFIHSGYTEVFLVEVWMDIQIERCRNIWMSEDYTDGLIVASAFYPELTDTNLKSIRFIETYFGFNEPEGQKYMLLCKCVSVKFGANQTVLFRIKKIIDYDFSIFRQISFGYNKFWDTHFLEPCLQNVFHFINILCFIRIDFEHKNL